MEHGNRVSQQVETMFVRGHPKPIGVATTPTPKSTTLNLQPPRSSGDVLSSPLQLYIYRSRNGLRCSHILPLLSAPDAQSCYSVCSQYQPPSYICSPSLVRDGRHPVPFLTLPRATQHRNWPTLLCRKSLMMPALYLASTMVPQKPPHPPG